MIVHHSQHTVFFTSSCQQWSAYSFSNPNFCLITSFFSFFLLFSLERRISSLFFHDGQSEYDVLYVFKSSPLYPSQRDVPLWQFDRHSSVIPFLKPSPSPERVIPRSVLPPSRVDVQRPPQSWPPQKAPFFHDITYFLTLHRGPPILPSLATSIKTVSLHSHFFRLYKAISSPYDVIIPSFAQVPMLPFFCHSFTLILFKVLVKMPASFCPNTFPPCMEIPPPSANL